MVIPFLPLESLAGRFRADSAYVGPAEWALGLAIFGVAAWLLAWALPGPALRAIDDLPGRFVGGGTRSTLLLLSLLGGLLILVSPLAFEGNCTVHRAPESGCVAVTRPSSLTSSANASSSEGNDVYVTGSDLRFGNR